MNGGSYKLHAKTSVREVTMSSASSTLLYGALYGLADGLRDNPHITLDILSVEYQPDVSPTFDGGPVFL